MKKMIRELFTLSTRSFKFLGVLFALIFALSLIGLLPARPVQAVGTCGSDAALKGCWLFNEGTGTTANDGSLNGNNGTINGATWVADRFGSANKALHFDGSNDVVQIPDSASLDITGDMTIAAWVMPDLVATQYVVKKAHQSSMQGYELGMSTGSGTTCAPGTNPCAFGRFRQVPEVGVDDFRINAVTTYTALDPWTFYVVVKAGTLLSIYKNGVLNNTRTVAAFTTYANSEYLGIGAQFLAGTASNFFNGSIDDVRIYSRALIAAEILALYDAPTSVVLKSFTATRAKNSILLNWETTNEVGNVGFNLYRATSLNGARIKLNTALIPTLVNPGSLDGAFYSYKDTDLTPNKTYYYWLEDVDISGKTGLTAPKSVNVLAGKTR
jgi:hypothetical protein